MTRYLMEVKRCSKLYNKFQVLKFGLIMAETCLKSSHPTSVSLVLLTASSLQSEQTNMLQSNGEEITRARGPIAKAALI